MELFAEQISPPRTRRRRAGLSSGFSEPLGNAGRHGGVCRVVTQHFFGVRKFARGLLLRLLFSGVLLLLLFLGKFGLLFHIWPPQAVFLKRAAKVLRARCNFPRTASGDC